MKNKILVFLFFVWVTVSTTYAQCAMCKATVETHARSGENKAESLNVAIIYLMVIPYICAALFYYLYKQQKKKSSN